MSNATIYLKHFFKSKKNTVRIFVTCSKQKSIISPKFHFLRFWWDFFGWTIVVLVFGRNRNVFYHDIICFLWICEKSRMSGEIVWWDSGNDGKTWWTIDIWSNSGDVLSRKCNTWSNAYSSSRTLHVEIV